MCELKSLIHRLVISKYVKVASSWKQEWQHGTIRRYGTVRLNFCWKVRYAFFVMVRVRYASKIELKYGTLVRYCSKCEVRQRWNRSGFSRPDPTGNFQNHCRLTGRSTGFWPARSTGFWPARSTGFFTEGFCSLINVSNEKFSKGGAWVRC